MEFDLDPNPKFARGLSILTHRIHGVPTRGDATAALRLPLTSGRAGVSGGNCVAR